jgi:hypothetical protein
VTLSGEAEAPGLVNVKVNDPDAQAQQQTGELTEWGTYTFDIHVEEVDAANNAAGDEQYLKWNQLRKRCDLIIPPTMPGVVDEAGNELKGHRLFFVREGAVVFRPESTTTCRTIGMRPR